MSELLDTYHLFLYQHQISSLKSFRKDNSLTQRQLADILGVSRTTLQCWENGYRNLPKDIYKKLFEAGMKII
ncbi:helix-turn-helix domain-containing protein [[Clostridium] scindens]|nr:helix-turn-helix transcriptional regulator [[Clostridium] scindens]